MSTIASFMVLRYDDDHEEWHVATVRPIAFLPAQESYDGLEQAEGVAINFNVGDDDFEIILTGKDISALIDRFPSERPLIGRFPSSQPRLVGPLPSPSACICDPQGVCISACKFCNPLAN